MTTKLPIVNTIDSPLPVGEWLRVRLTKKAVEMMKLTKKQIEVTMFAAGVGTLEGLRGWLRNKSAAFLE